MAKGFDMLLLGAVIGGIATFALTRVKGLSVDFGGPKATVNANPAFGYDYAVGGYNTSEFWDLRDKTYVTDNYNYNKLPPIDLNPATVQWNVDNMNIVGGYSQSQWQSRSNGPLP